MLKKGFVKERICGTIKDPLHSNVNGVIFMNLTCAKQSICGTQILKLLNLGSTDINVNGAKHRTKDKLMLKIKNTWHTNVKCANQRIDGTLM